MNRHCRTERTLLPVVMLLLVAGVALADGMIVPIRPEIRVRGEWAVKYHHVKIQVHDQVAEVNIDQAFVNIGKAPIEVEYLFPIPPGAGIDKLTMIADGKEMAGKLMKADDARRIYEQIVRAKKDPALLEYVGYGLYKTSVFPLPPGKERRVQVRYTAVCKKDRDLVEVHYPLNTEKFSAKAIDDVTVTVDITSRTPIGPVYSPTHDLSTERKGPKRVIATYQVKKAIPNTDFQVLYQVDSGDVGATVLTHKPDKDKDGYFMVLVSPNPADGARKVMAKDIIFVLDQSGSMGGDKIKQAREALKWTLRNLNAADRFNVVSFSDVAETMFNVELVDADRRHVNKAIEMVDRIEATGGTNIKEAIEKALPLLTDDARPKYVLFLTDGKPTVGDTSERNILAAAAKANTARARVFCLGVGYGVNTLLVDKLSEQNRGVSSYVKETEPLEGKISGLYSKIRNPVMTDLKMTIDGADIRQLYPRQIGDLFHGQQIVLAGRYGKGGRREMVIAGQYLGKQRAFEYNVELDKRSEDNANAFVERVWAMRRIGYLMDQIALHGENEELKDELIRLSRDYGIMTPYTAFLAEEDTRLGDAHYLRQAGKAANMAGRLRAATGEAAQRASVVREMLKSADKAAPAAPPVALDADGTAAPGPVFGGGMIGNSNQKSYEAERVEQVANLRQVANTTLYRRGNRWFTPDLAKQAEKADDPNIKTLAQFSEAYFNLVAANTVEENRVLASQQAGEELMVSLRGTVYRILPAGR